MIKLTKEQILLLHSELIKMTGGSDGIRDIGLLESALETPFQSYGGEELYPSIQAKAARLCYGLVKNHAMVDGNKRLVFMQCWCFYLSMDMNWSIHRKGYQI